MNRLTPQSSLLMVVDVQERLAAAMPEEDLSRLVANASILLEAARILGVAVVASEQYPKGLGPTVAALRSKLTDLGVTPEEKLDFDACSEPRIARIVAERSPHAVVVAGMETHVCVYQTARELVRRGYETYVVVDAVSSRRPENRAVGLSLCERAGAHATSTEAVVFDWVAKAGTDAFRQVSRLVR